MESFKIGAYINGLWKTVLIPSNFLSKKKKVIILTIKPSKFDRATKKTLVPSFKSIAHFGSENSAELRAQARYVKQFSH